MDSLRDNAQHTETASSVESRADTSNDPDPYGLQLTEAELAALQSVLGAETWHGAIGFLTGALTIPEPLGFEEWVDSVYEPADAELLEQADADAADHIPESIEVALRKLFESVQQRVAAGAVTSLVPHAQDASACDDWLQGLDRAICQTLHDPVNEEIEICGRLFDRRFQMGLTQQSLSDGANRESLDSDVKRLIALWREVPPFDPEEEERRGQRWSQVVPKRPELPKETIIHSGGTFVRTEAKVGRNELCPCGSGKKHKKCCA